MAETEPQESVRIDPTENLAGWLDKRDAEPAENTVAVESEPVPASPAQPTVAEQPPPPQPDWYEAGLADVSHGFLKGRKGPEVEKAFRHVETAKQQAERERNELRQRLAQYEAQRAPEAPKGIEPNLWFENPDEAQRRIDERIAKVTDEKLNAYIQKTQAEQQTARALDNGGKAYDSAREALNLDAPTFNLRAPAVMLHLTDPNSPFYGDGNGLFDKDRYVEVYRALWPEPVAPVVVASVPEPALPPGSKKAAPMVSTATTSSLSREEREARKVIAEYTGLDAEKLYKRAENRRK